METVAGNSVEIVINGKDVTREVSPFLSRVTYTDRLESESDDVSFDFEDTSGNWIRDWFPTEGDALQVKLGPEGNMLDCGLFEFDQIRYTFPPDLLTASAIAAAVTKSLRTKNSKAFENQTLKKIAQYFADKHGLKQTGDTSEMQKIEVERKTQDNQTDLAFLASLATEYGFVFSVRGNQLVFMSIETLESQAPVLTFSHDDISTGEFCDKTTDTYNSATVATRNIKTNLVKRWSTKAGKDGGKDELVITTRVETETQAKAKTKAQLLAKLREKTSGRITVPGDIRLVAGITIELTNVGEFSGKWLVFESTHKVDPNTGYTTDATIRKVVQANV